MEEETPIIEQKSSVKLIKTTKGYNWEVKVYDADLDKILAGIEKLDRAIKAKYENKT